MADTKSHLAFLGTYTDGDSEGIYTYRVDAATGDLERQGVVAAGENPSFLALHPSGEFLYAVNEVDDGSVAAFSVDRESGELTRLNRASCGDDGPCHCTVDATGSYVLVANYWGGSVSMHPIREDGGVGDPTHVVDHEGSGPNADRQANPHPHSVNPGPDNSVAYVPDLGTDEVVRYELDLDAGKLRRAGATTVSPGAGPRHLDFSPDGSRVYLINELDSTITTFERDGESGALSEIDTVSTLPHGFDGESTTADIHVHPSGEWLYGSNRGHDSIAVYEIDPKTGEADLVGHESTRGECPRNFALDPSGQSLFAENQNTNDVVVFDIDRESGELAATDCVETVPRPVCMKFLSGE